MEKEEAINKNIEGHKADEQMIREAMLGTKADPSH